MGRAARANARSPEGWKASGDVERARLKKAPVSTLVRWLFRHMRERAQASAALWKRDTVKVRFHA